VKKTSTQLRRVFASWSATFEFYNVFLGGTGSLNRWDEVPGGVAGLLHPNQW